MSSWKNGADSHQPVDIGWLEMAAAWMWLIGRKIQLDAAGCQVSGLLKPSSTGLYFHIPRILAATSILIWLALRPVVVASTFGQLVCSKNCRSMAGMKRVREA
jgi:hypothetical protein